MAGDLPPEEKASLVAAQFTIRTLESSNASPRIESIIHQLDAYALAGEGPIEDHQQLTPPDEFKKMHEPHASTRC